MITKWRISNFKSIREATELDLEPLTIFAGANSSGKSTFIQSVLLIAQTLAHKVGSRSVVLNGAFTSLGQFDDLRSNDSSSEQITIGCTCRPLKVISGSEFDVGGTGDSSEAYLDEYRSRIEEIFCELSFDADASNPQRDLFQIQPRLFASRLTCTCRDEENIDEKASIAVVNSRKIVGDIIHDSRQNPISDQMRTGLAFDVHLDDQSLSEIKDVFISAKPAGCFLKHFLPDRILYQLNDRAELANRITKSLQEVRGGGRLLRSTYSRNLVLPKTVVDILLDALSEVDGLQESFLSQLKQRSLFEDDAESLDYDDWYQWLRSLRLEDRVSILQQFRDGDDLFERVLNALRESEAGVPESYSFRSARTPRLIRSAVEYMDNFFAGNVKYLGPLRDAPRPMYPLAPAADPNDVGLRGEHTASILDLHKRKQIHYIPASSFRNPVVDRKLVTRSLEAAVVDWLQYLGVAESVASKDKGKLGHELKVSLVNSDIEHDLTHVGVGVSQVLPILVVCLLADQDATLVFEQPELHLHPKVQTLLGDFFLSMALSNKQCIVETHSEYLIDRLRFRIAAASETNPLTDLSRIYFVEKSNMGSAFKEVEVNDYGAIVDWPNGFFDQSQQQAEQILRAASQKRKSRRSKHHE
jgi:predicted ATPase